MGVLRAPARNPLLDYLDQQQKPATPPPAAQQQQSLLAPPPPPPQQQYPQAVNESTAPRPTQAVHTPAPVAPPIQPNAPVGGYAQRADGTWGPAGMQPASAPAAATAINQGAAQPAGGGAVSTRHTQVSLDPNANVWPLAGGRYGTRAEYDLYMQMLNQNGIPQAVAQAPAVTNPATGQVTQPNVGVTPPGVSADTVDANKQPWSVYNDPLMQSLLQEVQARISGQTTAAGRQMNDLSQQQANASQQAIDRQMSGRNLGANNPLKAKLYNDIQQNVANQVLLRNAQLQEQALNQGTALFNAANEAKNVEAFRRQVENQQSQYAQSLAQQREQQRTANFMSLLSAIPGVGNFVGATQGFGSLADYMKSRRPVDTSPTINEVGFRLPQPGRSPFGGW